MDDWDRQADWQNYEYRKGVVVGAVTVVVIGAFVLVMMLLVAPRWL